MLARRRAGAGSEGVPRDELVEVLVDLVVAHVGHDVAVRGEGEVRALVLHAPEHRVLARGGGRVVRVDLDDPAEPERLVRLGREVEARVDLAPAPRAGAGDAVAGVRRRVPAVEGARPVEVLVEVLLAAQHRAPGRRPAGAVVERPQHGRARPGLRRSGAEGLRRPGRRPGTACDPVIRRLRLRLSHGHLAPPTGRGIVPAHLDDRHPVALDLHALHRRASRGSRSGTSAPGW